LGSSQYGKTNLLQGIIRSVLQTMTSEEINIYILDFGTMILKNFESSNHVGGVVCSNEDEKLKNLFKLIENEINVRKEKLASVGVSSYAAYREAGYTDMPQIYLIIDNLTALIELYLEDDDTLLVFIREGVAVGVTTIAANSQTAGVSYKYLANFANKIVLYCNDSSEYSNIFDHVSMQPKEVPGRCVFEMEKRMLECQTYLAFEGEKEIERVAKIREFIEKVNSNNFGKKAKTIPYIPAILSEEILVEDYGVKAVGYRIPFGLTYAEVEPFFLKINQLGALGICGKEGSGHKNIIDYIMKCLQDSRNKYPVEVCIFDDITYKYKQYQELEIVSEYIINPEEVTNVLADYHTRLIDRYQMLLDGGTLEKQPLLLMIIQNNDVARIIAEDITLQEQYSEILSRYKRLNVCFIYANYANASVSYDAPEPLHMIKEEQHLLLLDNLADLKVFEPDYEALRRYKKKVGTGDAYYIQGNNIEKIKLVLSDK
ncbi:MAG: FtsK/SpoIIIE domain-containing protein, partial [Porphyromonadaceae bacterium]|nr:FtsK/SpoIIIE domain-containing protein [Porphyromonadaceae bacterium]